MQSTFSITMKIQNNWVKTNGYLRNRKSPCFLSDYYTNPICELQLFFNFDALVSFKIFSLTNSVIKSSFCAWLNRGNNGSSAACSSSTVARRSILNGLAAVINEHLFTGTMGLPHREPQMLLPLIVKHTELRIAVSRAAVPFAVFFP
jgi:hypothetical protein